MATTGEREWLLTLIRKLVIYALPPVGLMGALLLLALGQYQFLILSIYMIVPVIVAPVLYIALSNRSETPRTASGGEEEFRMLLTGFLFCFAFSLTLLYAFEIRPLAYYVVIAAMATIVFVQISRCAITPGKTAVILLQIMAMSLNISWGITLKYFQFVGRTDMLPHTFYTESLIQLGHVTPVLYDYEPFPLWHIMNAGISMAAGAELPVYKVMAVTGALAFVLLPGIVYLIGAKLFGDDRTALTAALVVSFFPDIVLMGVSTIARVVAQVLMVFLLYMLIAGKGRARYLLIVPLTAGILLYHSISILFIILILFIIYCLQILFVRKQERFVSLGYIAFATILTAGYWMLNANIMIQRLISNASAPSTPISLPQALVENVPWNELFNYLQYTPSLLLILVGAFLLMRPDLYGGRARVIGVAALSMSWLAFPGPVLLIGKLAEGLGIERVSEYTFPLLVLASAAGLAGLYSRTGKYGRTVVVALFAVWVLLAVSNDWVASDNPLVERPFYTYYFSGQEIAGMDRLVTHVTGVLQSDYVPNRYYESSPYEPITTLIEVDTNNQTFVRRDAKGVLLIRNGEQAKRELRIGVLDDSRYIHKPERGAFGYYSRSQPVWDTLPAYNRVYDSGAITAYN
ncbi:MAG: hypothetical protein A4E28_02146 [Methanocella sp. PtaU1.Bin125]|nr:MAG: hypothetical protein A4E28_02146 [Methanocella sp. PtaU1.Bin125]